MTVNLTQEAGKAPRNRKGAPGPRVVLFARVAIFIERAAPIAILAGAPIAALAIASLFDAWSATPRWAHGLALIAGAGLAVSLGYRFRRRDLWPTRAQALARLEADGGVRHDALQTLEDRSFAGAGPQPAVVVVGGQFTVAGDQFVHVHISRIGIGRGERADGCVDRAVFRHHRLGPHV